MGKGKSLLLVSGVAALLALSALVTAISQSVKAQQSATTLAHHNCVDIESVKSYIESAIKRSLRTLPTLTYYREHPGELAIARADLLLERKQFSRSECRF